MGKNPATLTFTLLAGLAVGMFITVSPFLLTFLPSTSKYILSGFGLFLFFVFGVLVVITRLYRKAAADEAFVRTGQGGNKVIIDGGCLVIPVMHEVIPVSLRTFKLEVKREGENALLTKDFLRARIEAVFYVKVEKDPKVIAQAASSLGMRLSGDGSHVKELVFDKLVSALRNVAANQNLNDLNTKRAEFAEEVQKIVQEDLKQNGLTLESVTISQLDQESPEAMRPETNVFDAKGVRTITETVQSQRIERNKIERGADKQVAEQNVEAEMYLANKKVEEETAKANAESQIREARSRADAKANKVAADQKRESETAEVEAMKSVEVARVQQQQAIEVANQLRDQARRVAEQEAQKAIELAQQKKQTDVAAAEEARAKAEAQQLAAERARKAAEEAVKTTQAEAEAQREKVVNIIARQAQAEQRKIEDNMKADVEAYAREKQAEAERNAAQKHAEARMTLAEAEKTAKVSEAEGDRAVQMVPVEVERERVKVVIQELEGKTKFQEIAKELELEMARIAAQKEASIAASNAMGVAIQSANMTLWGDPNTVAQFAKSFYQGQNYSAFAEGLFNQMPGDLKDLTLTGAIGAGSAIAGVLKKVLGIDLDAEALETLIAKKDGDRPKKRIPDPLTPAVAPERINGGSKEMILEDAETTEKPEPSIAPLEIKEKP